MCLSPPPPQNRSETPQLFTVVPEKRTATVGTAMMGSTHIYDMSAVSPPPQPRQPTTSQHPRVLHHSPPPSNSSFCVSVSRVPPP